MPIINAAIQAILPRNNREEFIHYSDRCSSASGRVAIIILDDPRTSIRFRSQRGSRQFSATRRKARPAPEFRRRLLPSDYRPRPFTYRAASTVQRTHMLVARV